MKTKTGSKRSSEQPVIDPRLLEAAKMTVFEPKPEKTFACSVCGSEGATEQSERLCWVVPASQDQRLERHRAPNDVHRVNAT